MKALAALFAIAAFAIAAFSQPRLEFEVASVRASAAPTAGRVNVGAHVDGAQVSFTYLSLRDYIRTAYRLKDFQVLGPEWLASQRFDITAKVPADAPPGKIAEMLQALLEERFQLKQHREMKEFPVYGLLAGKDGLRMKEVPDDPAEATASAGTVNVAATGSQAGTSVDLGRGSSFSFGNGRFEGTKLTMAAIAETFTRFLERPVVDMTDLKGKYSFILEVSPEDYQAMMVRSALSAGVVLPPQALRVLDSASGDSVFAAVQKLGLKLEPRRSKLEVLVVDSMAKAPTEN